jgi:hypothetical protein
MNSLQIFCDNLCIKTGWTGAPLCPFPFKEFYMKIINLNSSCLLPPFSLVVTDTCHQFCYMKKYEKAQITEAAQENTSFMVVYWITNNQCEISSQSHVGNIQVSIGIIFLIIQLHPIFIKLPFSSLNTFSGLI